MENTQSSEENVSTESIDQPVDSQAASLTDIEVTDAPGKEQAVVDSHDEVPEMATETSEPSDERVEIVAVERSAEESRSLVEALIFASGDPISVDRLREVTRMSREEIETAIAEIREASTAQSDRGIELVLVAGKYQFRTKALHGVYLQELKAGKPRRLSAAALETLAVIAYRQPVVKSDIEKIRGVDVTPTLKTLLERELVKIVGHQATVGQPTLYGTTEQFLKIFGLSSLGELPTLRDLNDLHADPGEIDEDDDSEGMPENLEVPQPDDVPVEQSAGA